MNGSYLETYKGTQITVVTARRGHAWTSHASYKLSGQDEVRLNPAERDYASEDEARRAALQSAVENIDRDRSSIGKP
jgi:hypothetical protein